MDETHSVVSLADCADKCAMSASSRFRCASFAYRSSGLASANCVLSRLRSEDIVDFSDLVRHSEWDVFVFDYDRRECDKYEGVEDNNDNVNSGDDEIAGECYDRDRRGYRFLGTKVNLAVNARDVSACSEACRSTTRFECRAFAFRLRPDNYDNEGRNCHLTDLDVRELDGYSDTVADAAWNIYDQRDTRNCR